MKTTMQMTLSTSTIVRAARQPSQQSLQILEFMHRFRHVTNRHIRLSLGHTQSTTSFKQLSRLLAQGYIARQYAPADRASNRPASYYVTLQGMKLLQAQNPTRE